jgi:hypothetical protein
MMRLDWDRELREARKRKHGSIPLWGDPGALSPDDERAVWRLLDPMVEPTNEFLAMSRTHRRQRSSEFEYRLETLKDHAVCSAGGLASVTARRKSVLARRNAH